LEPEKNIQNLNFCKGKHENIKYLKITLQPWDWISLHFVIYSLLCDAFKSLINLLLLFAPIDKQDPF
jgi:hypothetical protein